MPRKLPDEYDAWSTPEIAILSATYPQGGARSVQAKLPERSLKSIQCKARKAGLVYEHRRPWTADDDARLRGNWGLEDIDHIVRFLGRSRLSVVYRAAQLGLDRGAPEGWEFLTRSVDRSGYGIESLRIILKWAGVRILPSYSFASKIRHGRARHKWRRHIVEPDDVDEAIERWCETESLRSAATRHGLLCRTLMRFMGDCNGNFFSLPKRNGKVYVRALSSEWDRAVQEQSRRETVVDGAARHGISQSALHNWLRIAGFQKNRRGQRVDKALVDRVVAENKRRWAA